MSIARHGDTLLHLKPKGTNEKRGREEKNFKFLGRHIAFLPVYFT